MNSLTEFFSFSDPNVAFVVLGSLLLGASAAIVGCFTFLRKRALVGDAIAHAILPGVCVAFILTAQKNPLILLAGAVVAGWLSLLAMDYIVNRTKLKADTAIGLVLSVFFGLGIMLLTAIQHSGSASQAGLDKFLFGKAASMTRQDVIVFGTTALILLMVVLMFFKEFKLVSFDPDYAQSIGLPVRRLEFLLATITVMAVAVGIQAVGVVLMAALLITPAAAARFWTDDIRIMLLLAAAFGILSAIFGSYVSYVAPSMPTGPWIVVLLSVMALASVFLAPRRGIMARLQLQRSNARKMMLENILKTFYAIGEPQKTFFEARSLSALQEQRAIPIQKLRRGLQRLQRGGLIERNDNQTWQLTEKGLAESRQVVRRHRLWELYLNQRLLLAADHVHNDAEAIEHILTPEVEAQLEHELDYPVLDPHQSEIPPKAESGRRKSEGERKENHKKS
jgi:manganese/zinc/iron transport system permease protein